MAFGLTGPPGTFQGAMNTTLVLGVHCFVIVFFDDILVYNWSYEDHLHATSCRCLSVARSHYYRIELRYRPITAGFLQISSDSVYPHIIVGFFFAKTNSDRTDRQ